MSERKVGVINIVEREPVEKSSVLTSTGTVLLVYGWRELDGNPHRPGEKGLEIQVGSESYDLVGATREQMLAHRQAGEPYPLPPPRPTTARGVTYERLRVRLTEHPVACAVALSDGSELCVTALSVGLDMWDTQSNTPKLTLRLAPESYTLTKEEKQEAA